jgi:predicted TIM-barrel fold metal-dependent hydrolase
MVALAACILYPAVTSAQTGEELFVEWCEACHTIGGGDLVGPDLAGVTERRSMEWLIKAVQNSEALIAAGDADAVALAQAAFLNRTLEDIIGDMDAAGIDRACIVAMDLSTHYGVKLGTNEDVARMSAAHPDRLIPFASVDPSMGRLAVDGLIHAVEELGCRGLKLVPPVQHFDFSDPKHHPLWEAALDLDILVWTHTAHQKSHPDSDARLGHPMLVEPVTLKYPELKIVLGHCGFPWVWETWSLVARRPNVYVDISAYPSLYNHFPWDAYSKADVETRVLFATDYPLLSFEETRNALDAVSISEDFRSKILGENAAVLLGL